MASRTDFDAAMANNDIEWLLQNTFMARVPDLIISGMSIEGAIIEAKRQEEKLRCASVYIIGCESRCVND